MVYSTDRSKAVVPALVLLFVAYWFILRGDLLSLALCYFVLVFLVLIALQIPRLGKRELILVLFSPFSIAITSLGEEWAILVLFVRLFDLRLFGFVCFLFLLLSGKGCGLWLWHSLDFALTFFFNMNVT